MEKRKMENRMLTAVLVVLNCAMLYFICIGAAQTWQKIQPLLNALGGKG